MFNKFELVIGAVSVGFMALALYMIQTGSIISTLNTTQPAQTIDSRDSGVIIVTADSDNVNQTRANAYLEAADKKGNLNRMVIDDVKVGTGDEVKEGDTVVVHYIGTLQNGQEFDNSHKRGEAFEFKVGAGRVIEGWEKGVVGMKVGGQRILVIPPDMAYGADGIGPIPGNATLVFAIELLEVK